MAPAAPELAASPSGSTPVGSPLAAQPARFMLRGSAAGWIISLSLLVSCFVLGLVGTFLIQSRSETLRDSARELGVWAQQLGQEVEHLLFDTDTQLAALGERIAAAGAESPEAFVSAATTEAMHEWLREVASRSSGLGGLVLVSQQGQRIASSRVFPTPRIDLSDRVYFAQAQSDASAATIITAAMKNRQTGIDTVFLARRLDSAGGQFLGLAVANIPSPRFTRAFNRAQADGREVALIRRSGELIVAGRGTTERFAARVKQQLPQLQAAWHLPSETSWRHAHAGPNSSADLVVTYPLLGYPLAMVLTAPQSAVLADWEQSARLIGAITFGALALLWGLSLVAIRQVKLRGQERASALLIAAQKSLQACMTELVEARVALAEAHQGNLATSANPANPANPPKSPPLLAVPVDTPWAELPPRPLQQVTPIEAPAEPAAASLPTPLPSPAVADGELSVLYVEDHPANIALMEAMCAGRAGILLSVASSGSQAITSVAAHRPHMMLVDMNLGDMTGIELRQALLANGLLQGVRMVALSADAMPMHIQAAEAAGFDQYLTKPLRVRELLAAFAEARRVRSAG